MTQKYSRAAVSNAASILTGWAERNGFSSSNPGPDEIQDIELVELAAKFKRALAEGRKRISIDLQPPRPTP